MTRSRRSKPSQLAPPTEPAKGSVLDAVDCPPRAEEQPAAQPSQGALSVLAAVPVCGTARIDHIDGDELGLAFGTEVVKASCDPSVHRDVLAGALERQERVLAEHRPGQGWVVVGALRTQPTPGIDAADQYRIEADQVTIHGRSEVAMTTRTASVVIRALGEVETYAERIISRAEGVHKIIGRILRLN